MGSSVARGRAAGAPVRRSTTSASRGRFFAASPPPAKSLDRANRSTSLMETAMPFRDRIDAGQKLASALLHLRDKQPVVLALPRGGVPVAAEVAEALHAPLDLVLVRKIGMPTQPEVAMGAVVDGCEPVVQRNEDIIHYARITEPDFRALANAELAEIERRHARYLSGRARIDPAGRVVILVDDGVATGATVRASLRAVRRRNPARLVLAVPLGPLSTIEDLRREVDELVCLEVYEHLGSVGQCYGDFRQCSDAEVLAALARCPVAEDEGADDGAPAPSGVGSAAAPRTGRGPVGHHGTA
jgi:putative phosphoribosyl transferase